jgi:hypothetical protein
LSDILYLLQESAHEIVVDSSLNYQARPGDARLSRSDEAGKSRTVDSTFYISVIKNCDRGLFWKRGESGSLRQENKASRF